MSPTDNELWRLSATELAAATKTRRAASAEVIEAHLGRIEVVNAVVSAVVVVLADQAREAARAATD